jgi:NAD(P)H-nitrite reductase large subunit
MMLIDRCICTGRTFAEILALSKARGCSLEEVADQTGATRGCGLCKPYLTRSFATGETQFTELLPCVFKNDSACPNSPSHT